MKPPKIEYEKVRTDDFVTATIADIEYDETHEFKFEGKVKTSPAVRFKFAVDGYQFPHFSRWMSFTYSEKSNLFLKYLVPLVDNAVPDLDFDLDGLRGRKIKMLWAEKNGFQFPEVIRSAEAKNPPTAVASGIDGDLEPDEHLPF